MSWSFRFGRIRGIELRVHITFVLILIWGAYYWGNIADDTSRGALFGVVATLFLFLCVLLHELGHAVQALEYDIPVEDITLYPIGGIARLREIPRNPRQEFRIAIAGPLVNVAIVALLAIGGWIAGEPAFLWPGDLFDQLRDPGWNLLLPYLVFANLSLALFNLLPAFPMDGGRILRSILAMRLPYARATGIAASVGQAMALLFGLYGFATGQFMLILVAIFVWMGASEEGRSTTLREMLGTSRVREAMIRQPWSVAPEFPLSRAVELTLTTAQSDFPVVDRNGVVVGLLTLADLLQSLPNNPNGRIGDVMRSGLTFAQPEELIADVQDRLALSGGRALPVVSNSGQLLGLLTLSDVTEIVSLLSAQSTGSNGRHPS